MGVNDVEQVYSGKDDDGNRAKPDDSPKEKAGRGAGLGWLALTTMASNISAMVTVALATYALLAEHGFRHQERAERQALQAYDAKVRELDLQERLRERWVDWHQATAHLEVDRYPDTLATYSPSDRQLIRQYWSVVVYNEWSTVSQFGDGIYSHLWDSTYATYASSSLETLKPLREEWCEFARPRPLGDTDARSAYLDAMNTLISVRVPSLDCEKELTDRKAQLDRFRATQQRNLESRRMDLGLR